MSAVGRAHEIVIVPLRPALLNCFGAARAAASTVRGTMRRIAMIAVPVLLIAGDASAISRYDTASMSCARVQAPSDCKAACTRAQLIEAVS